MMHAEPPPRPLYEVLLGRQLQHLAEKSDIRWQHVFGCGTRFTLQIPFCCEMLTWQVEFQRVAGSWIPDLVFPDEGFNPLLPSAGEEPLGGFLQEWRLEEEARLLRLLKRVIRRFSAHQRRVILEVGEVDWRLQQAAEAIATKSGPPSQMLYTHGHPGKATIVVAIEGLDFSRLQPFMARKWAAGHAGFSSDHIAHLFSKVALRVVWPVASGATPQVSYAMPTPLEDLLGRPSPPPFGSRSLEEYVPAAVDVLERRCESAGDSAMARQDLLEELPRTKLGEAVEIDVIAARNAVYNLWHEGCLWTVWLYLGQEFPDNNPPEVVLERQPPMHFERSYTGMPWSPRWTPKEMAKRISSFVSGEVKAASKGVDSLDYTLSQASI